MFSPNFLPIVLLAVTFTGVSVSASHNSSKLATHRVRNIGRGVKVETFHPKTTYEASQNLETLKAHQVFWLTSY
jgi:extracellular elastinolytic metalloproteinase